MMETDQDREESVQLINTYEVQKNENILEFHKHRCSNLSFYYKIILKKSASSFNNCSSLSNTKPDRPESAVIFKTTNTYL